MAPYPVPPARKRNPAPIIVSVAVAVILVVVAVIALGGRHGDSVGNAGAGQTSSAPDQANQPTAPAMSFPSYNPPSRGSDGSVPASDSPAAPSSSDLMAGAQVGDCFYDNGTGVNADLATASCGPGTWQVVQINDDTTSLASCDNVKDSNESVSSSRDNLVLCLSYLSPGGTAYHAHVGDCVYGPNSPSSVWDKQSCQTGNFTVIARIPGTTDTGKCNAEGVWDESETFTVDKSSTMDLVLCLTMNWPDAAGSAQQNACLLKTGTDSAPVFKHVSSCSQANVVVTGRTSTYDDPSFCGNDGAAWWKSSDFPKIAYTVCWRWK